jgi:hypothetical protein
LSIDPTSHNFATRVDEDQTFTVTNHGPGPTGPLDVSLSGDDGFGLSALPVEVQLVPAPGGFRQAQLIVDDPNGGEAVAILGAVVES